MSVPPLPDPLTPIDCDLQDFPFMPLHVARLRDSDLAAEADPEACWYAVLLWAASWHQLPAGSLPNNDAVLTRLIGLGRDTATFERCREQALRGFVLCSDGRLYHPVVAEQVCSAWEGKTAYQERKAARTEIARRAAGARWSRDADASSMHDASNGDASSIRDASPPDASRTSDAMPKGRGRGRGTGTTGEEADASPPDGRGAPGEGEAGDRAFSELRELYAELVVRGRGSPMIARSAWLRLDAADRLALPAAVKRFAAAKPWGSSGPPGLDRFIADDIWRDFTGGGTVTSIVWSGPADLRTAVVAETSEAFARSYLDPAAWVASARSPTVVGFTAAAAAKLRALRCLADISIQDPILPRKLA